MVTPAGRRLGGKPRTAGIRTQVTAYTAGQFGMAPLGGRPAQGVPTGLARAAAPIGVTPAPEGLAVLDYGGAPPTATGAGSC
jgi:hypothetical protein